MPDLSERLALRARPPGEAVMHQHWRDLLFLHWPVEPDVLLPHLPEGLDVDTFPDEQGVPRAWIGLVPFAIPRIRFSFGIPVPYFASFLEVNVRTYVHRRGRGPGVWFFTLDASRRIACTAARMFFGLNYLHADIEFRKGFQCEYRLRRLDEPHARLALDYSTADDLRVSQTDTLDFFLIERYLLYSERAGRLFQARVHHEPYPLSTPRLLGLETDMPQSIGLPMGPVLHTAFSRGVDVDIHALEPVPQDDGE